MVCHDMSWYFMNIMIWHDMSWCVMICHDMSWYAMMCRDISLFVVICHAMSWYLIIGDDMSWYVMMCRYMSWFVLICHDIFIPDICQFWDTTALWSPVKVHQKCVNLQQNSQNWLKEAKILPFCAKRASAWKKYTSAVVAVLTNISYGYIMNSDKSW